VEFFLSKYKDSDKYGIVQTIHPLYLQRYCNYEESRRAVRKKLMSFLGKTRK
jgi:hypothetical protein